ncbi:MAG TPA: hypothetical protein VKI40_04450 [Terriglobales bacterium]|jgi:hypothetical protein|nr:hypothetical protein [Terriglobales bacterium]
MNMSQEPKPRLREQEDSQGQPANKKKYQKPAFRYERVFETSAFGLWQGASHRGVSAQQKNVLMVR